MPNRVPGAESQKLGKPKSVMLGILLTISKAILIPVDERKSSEVQEIKARHRSLKFFRILGPNMKFFFSLKKTTSLTSAHRNKATRTTKANNFHQPNHLPTHSKPYSACLCAACLLRLCCVAQATQGPCLGCARVACVSARVRVFVLPAIFSTSGPSSGMSPAGLRPPPACGMLDATWKTNGGGGGEGS